MKTIATILAATIACAAVAPASAAPADAKLFQASYDKSRGLYCVHTTPLGARMAAPALLQKNCRTAQQWADAGLTFSHSKRVEVAQR